LLETVGRDAFDEGEAVGLPHHLVSRFIVQGWDHLTYLRWHLHRRQALLARELGHLSEARRDELFCILRRSHHHRLLLLLRLRKLGMLRMLRVY